MSERAEIYGVILAGGAARRMGGVDKGAALLAGKRLFDHVCERLAPQVGRVLVSGAHAYGAGLAAIPDHADGPIGPAGGLFAITRWLKTNAPDAQGFVTAPVDAPFLPLEFARRLTREAGSAIVSCAGQIHPTFAYWDVGELDAYFKSHNAAAPALHKIARSIGVREVEFETAAAFANINTPEDLKQAQAILLRNG